MPILTEARGAVHVLTIDRPERRGALNLDHVEALDAAVRAAVADGARAVVLTGTAGHFCAGADLSELEDVSFTQRLAEVLDHLATAPVLTVAAIEGSCMGLGMQLALASDLRVVADSARFAVPVARLGLMVDAWTMDRLTRFFGEGAARHLVLTAAVLDADDAWRLGFVQRRGGFDLALEVAEAATELAPLTQAGSKIGFGLHSADTAGHGAYREAFHRAWASDDLREGQQAFTERRKPVFRGR